MTTPLPSRSLPSIWAVSASGIVSALTCTTRCSNVVDVEREVFERGKIGRFQGGMQEVEETDRTVAVHPL